MDKLFRTRALTKAVNMIKPGPTRILDKVFKNKSRQMTSRFAWDIISGSDTLLDNLKVGDPASIETGTGLRTITCEAPRYAPKRFFSAADLDAIRQTGTQNSQALMSEKIAKNLRDMKSKVDRTREFQAAKAITGQIVDKNGVVLVDYNFTAAQKPVLTGTDLWTDAASDPLANIRTWQKQIVRLVGDVEFFSFTNKGAMDALLNNSNARELMKYTIGDQLAKKGRIANLAGTEIEEYWGSYTTDAGVVTDMIPNDAFIMVGVSMDTAEELFAPVVDLDDPSGVGKNRPASMFFSKSWDQKDPSGRFVKVESRPLPVIYKPECIIWATVI